MKKLSRWALMLGLLTPLAITTTACDDAGDNMEEAGENVEDAAEDVGDDIEDAVDGD